MEADQSQWDFWCVLKVIYYRSFAVYCKYSWRNWFWLMKCSMLWVWDSVFLLKRWCGVCPMLYFDLLNLFPSQALNKKEHRGCDSPDADASYVLTPNTQEKYKKINEEFDNMMKSHKIVRFIVLVWDVLLCWIMSVTDWLFLPTFPQGQRNLQSGSLLTFVFLFLWLSMRANMSHLVSQSS